MLILGIESSCDETSAAVLDNGRVLSNRVATQDEIHSPYGGVVPELASRRHMEVIIPVISSALVEAKINLTDIDGITVTRAPGLVGSLLVGLSVAKGIAVSKNISIFGVNHLEGHLGAVYLEYGDIEHPWVGMVVSGGHTSLYLVKGFGDYLLLGSTQDDAAGEAFDKVAKLLGLGYPGGPAVEKVSSSGDDKKFNFTTPRLKEGRFDFSFSGIKTAAMIKTKEAKGRGDFNKQFVADMTASFQKTAVGFLTSKLILAAKEYKAKAIAISGGVAANKLLRSELKRLADENSLGCYIPDFHHCTDNAAMIAFVGGKYLEMGYKDDLNLNATANEEIGV